MVDLLAIGRLDEGDRAGLGGAQCRSPNLALVCAGDGKDPTLVEVSLFGVGEPPLLGAIAEGLVEEAVDLAPRRLHVDADAVQLRGGVAPDAALGVKHGLNLPDDVRVLLNCPQHAAQPGEGPVAALQGADDVIDQPRALQHPHEAGLGQGRPRHFEQLDLGADFLEDQSGEGVAFHPDAAQFIGGLKGFDDGRAVCGGGEVPGAALRTFGLAQGLQQPLDLEEPQVLHRLGIEGHPSLDRARGPLRSGHGERSSMRGPPRGPGSVHPPNARRVGGETR